MWKTATVFLFLMVICAWPFSWNVNSETTVSPEVSKQTLGASALSGFPINVSKNTVDDFFPAPDFTTDPPVIRRAFDPFGMGMNWFQSSRIFTGRGGIRFTDVNLENAAYWMDMRIDLNDPPSLDIIDIQAGNPSADFPHWGFGHDLLDFRLAQTDIFGPPPRISIFGVGVDGMAYDLYFSLTGSNFILSDITSSGYIHYFPDKTAPQLAVITDTADAPIFVEKNGICFADLPVGTPIALFNVTSPDGEDYLNINYCGQTITQKFEIHDNIAKGLYAPIEMPDRIISLITGDDLWSFMFFDWISQPTREEQLETCIRDRTTLTIGLQRDNKLGEALLDLAHAFASEMKLQNKTLDAAKEALLDSKDVLIDVFSSGKTTPEKLSEFVLKTLLKNATPEEHEALIKTFFDTKIPDIVKTLAEGSGTAMEGQYKTALLGIIKGGVKTYYPRSSALAESIIEAQQWAIEAMADEDIRIMYRHFKENSGGDWEDFIGTWHTTRIRANKQIKIQQILEKQGKSATDADVQAYLKNLFEGWYSQENEFPEKLAQLEDLRDRYNDDWLLRREVERLMPNATECERMTKVFEWFSNARLDLLESMGTCAAGTPPKSDDIRSAAFDMLAQRIVQDGTPSDKHRIYQETKLYYLHNIWNCLNYEEPNPGQDQVDSPTDKRYFQLADTVLSPLPQQPHTWSDASGSHSATFTLTEKEIGWDIRTAGPGGTQAGTSTLNINFDIPSAVAVEEEVETKANWNLQVSGDKHSYDIGYVELYAADRYRQLKRFTAEQEPTGTSIMKWKIDKHSGDYEVRAKVRFRGGYITITWIYHRPSE